MGAPSTKIHSTVALVLLNYPPPSCRNCKIFLDLTHPTIDKPSIYTSQYVPAIPLSTYLERFYCYAGLTNETIICALIYVDRFITARKTTITLHELHRVILVASALAMKFFYDGYYENAHYAEVGGIPVKEFNTLEADFLDSIGYRLNIGPEEYSRYQKAVMGYAKKK